jgi:hypothetical protein
VSEDTLKLALRNGILQWQKKWGITDGDPILACLELYEIYFNAVRPSGDGAKPPSFEEFRSSLELIDQRGRTFTKQAAELIQELRAVPHLGKLRSYHATALILAAVAAFVAGLLAGRFLL